LVQRQVFYDLGKEAWNGPLVLRDRVCAREVFIELLGGDEAQFNQPKAREINETLRLLKGWTETASLLFSHYGRTRGFLKGDL
jgi:putative DNA primase/helicase